MWTQFLWVFIVGPVAALLPEAWRRKLPVAGHVHWERAAAISGFLEFCTGIAGLCYWYMRTMPPMISRWTEWAMQGKFGRDVTRHQIAGTALAVFFTHPVTWILAYAFLEGAVRLVGAAFTEDARGVLPLYVLERAVFLARHPGQARSLAQEFRRQLAAVVESVRERAMVARLEEVPDELHYTRSAAEEILEIWASRRKPGWMAPKIVRVDETYYRLEGSSVEKGDRPFRYRLRRLEAGVPGRGVISYQSAQALGKQ
jgi:hypothetical protein